MPIVMFFNFGLKMPIHDFQMFLEDYPDSTRQIEHIIKKLPKVKSTGHSGSNGPLDMPLSVVVSEKLPEQKRCDEEEAKEEEEVCLFCRRQHTDTKI